ncbi:winged helix-turn-helix domain-containing tetratricopeptide repeat protein [Sedimenticola selenatireducens]|jgi:DNA-binding winged helix-turn-helix (wHTH) protein/tetratricopeptide (TPR) repeat protein|uniref:OmpR/PhoB-type domain-containing protein n=1 Tax=Sedimenticola selenatireducens TaxID=191960 RepID=A0A557SKB7_9GAMM|nr:winged helix-turn-helix domain-containing protein [Sedimenticola selenatireducens]TVO77878.1 hypothetical protein FHP88_03500 [Sedimenticola selenatireducens]TVT65183.1 MAG: hypothetical protein FHK78_05865 [Sedimenticola selenatireducens]
MIIRFADMEIDTERYELRRKGERIAIEPLVFDLLVHFVTHPNTVFSRDDLIEVVWSGRIVSDSTVASCIKSARKALGDSGKRQIYIKTLQRRGFQFIGIIDKDQEPFAAQTRKSTALRAKYIEPSLIVLPFKAITDHPAIHVFAEGLVANLDAILNRIPLLRISSPASSYADRDVAPTARIIHEETGVDYVLEGNVQTLDNQIRTNIQLVDAKSGFRLWAGQFEQPQNDNKGNMDSAVIAIIAKLEPQLNRAIYNSVRTNEDEPSAQALYLEASGILALKGWHIDTFSEAADLLRRSAALDMDFALAPAYLSLILALGHRVGLLGEREQTREEAIQAAELALQLDNMDSTVLGFAGCAMADLGLVSRALPILKNAVELNPNNAQAWAALGSACLIDNNPELAVTYLTRGIDMSPLDNRLAVWEALLALALMLTHELEAAQARAELACQRDDRTYLSRVVLAAVLLCRRMPEAAQQALAEAYRIKPDLSDTEIDALITAKLGKQLRALC